MATELVSIDSLLNGPLVTVVPGWLPGYPAVQPLMAAAAGAEVFVRPTGSLTGQLDVFAAADGSGPALTQPLLADAVGRVPGFVASGSLDLWIAVPGEAERVMHVEPPLAALKHVVFPFAFDTPGLAAGVAAYVPTVGERLFGAWVETEVGWDGTTPKADFGLFVGSVHGLIAVNAVSDIRIDLPWANPPLDYTFNPGTGLLTPQNATGGTGGVGYYMAGAVFTTTDPFKVVVSQDGTAGGADPGATKGAAELHLLILAS